MLTKFCDNIINYNYYVGWVRIVLNNSSCLHYKFITIDNAMSTKLLITIKYV